MKNIEKFFNKIESEFYTKSRIEEIYKIPGEEAEKFYSDITEIIIYRGCPFLAWSIYDPRNLY